jgi:hypothetical protein
VDVISDDAVVQVVVRYLIRSTDQAQTAEFIARV